MSRLISNDDDTRLIDIDDDQASKCSQPCDPDSGCSDCAEYWDRMVSEGYWDRDRHRWTDKGWKEICK